MASPPPIRGRRGTWPCAHHFQVHCELCLLLQWSLALSSDIAWSNIWLGSTIHSTTVYNTTCTRAHKSRFRGAKGAIGRSVLSVLCGSASRPPAVWPALSGWEAGPAPSLRLPAASGTKRRPRSSWRRRRPSRAAALVDRTAVSVAKAAESRVFGRGLGGGDDWRRLRALGRVGPVVGDRERSVEGSVDSALRGV